MAVLFSDNFNRPDGSFSGDTNYNNGGDTDWEVASNLAAAPSDCTFIEVVASAASAYVQLVYRSNNSVDILMPALTPSASDLNDRYDFIFDRGAGTQRLRKRVSGSGTTLASGFGAPTTGQTIRLELNGTTLRVLYDGIEKASVTVSDLAGPFYGAVNAGDVGNPAVLIGNFVFGIPEPGIDSVTPSSFADGTTGIVIAGSDL